MEHSKTRMIAEAGVAIAIAQDYRLLHFFICRKVVPLRPLPWYLS